MSGQLNKAQNSLQKMGGSLTSIGSKMTMGITAPVVALGTAMFKTFADFESVMAELEARTGSTAAEMEKMKQFALEMGRDTAFSATQAAEALLELTSSGSSAAEAMEQLPAVLDLAAAGALELGAAADGVTDILAQFSLQAKDSTYVADQLAKAAGASSATVEDLVQAFGNVGPVAAQFGLSVEETAAAIATLSEAGIKGTEAGTNLKSMLLNMSKQTQPVADAWRKLGISMFDAAGNMRPIDDVFKDINAAMEGMSTEEQIHLSQDLAGSYGIVGFNALRAANGISDMQGAMDSAAGASEVAQARMNTLAGRFDSLMGSLETLGIVLGGLGEGPLTTVILWLTNAINKVTEFAQANPKLAQAIMVVVAALAALGPILVILGSIIGALGTISAAFAAGGMFAAGGALAGLAAIATPLLAVVAAVVAVGIAIKMALPLIKQIGEILLLTFANLVPAAAAAAQQLMVALGGMVFKVLADASKAAGQLITVLQVMALKALNAAATAAGQIIQIIITAAKAAMQAFWDWLSSSIQTLANKAVEAGNTIKNGLNSAKEGAGEFVSVWKRNMDMFGQIVGTLIEKAKYFGMNLILGFANGIKQGIPALWEAVKGMATGVVNAIKGALQISSPSRVMMEIGAQTVEGFNRGIAAAGGIGVRVPAVAGGGSGARGTSGVSVRGTASSGSGGGSARGGNVIIQNMNVPPGTTREQAAAVSREIARNAQRRGAKR